MPKRRAAVKSIRVSEKRRLHNRKIKQTLRKSMKDLQALVINKKKDEAKTALSKVSSLLDKAAKKKIIHPKTADRKKSRLALRIGKIA